MSFSLTICICHGSALGGIGQFPEPCPAEGAQHPPRWQALLLCSQLEASGPASAAAGEQGGRDQKLRSTRYHRLRLCVVKYLLPRRVFLPSLSAWPSALRWR